MITQAIIEVTIGPVAVVGFQPPAIACLRIPSLMTALIEVEGSAIAGISIPSKPLAVVSDAT